MTWTRPKTFSFVLQGIKWSIQIGQEPTWTAWREGERIEEKYLPDVVRLVADAFWRGGTECRAIPERGKEDNHEKP